MLNNFLSEGDELIKQIKRELNETPYIAKREMYNAFAGVNTDWMTFKMNCKTNPGQLIGGPSVLVDMPSTSNGTRSQSSGFDKNMQLAKGVAILEKTSQSLHRASQAAREAEGTRTLRRRSKKGKPISCQSLIERVSFLPEVGTHTLTELGMEPRKRNFAQKTDPIFFPKGARGRAY